MSKWSLLSLVLCFSVVSTSVSGQWTQAGGMMPSPEGQYPQSQYPDQSGPYPQSQYPANQGQAAPLAQGQQEQGSPDPADLQHGVARVSVVQGDVNVRRGDTGDLTGAVINAPMVIHDHLQTSAGSRAEVQLDAVTMIRVAPDTDLGFADLQYHQAKLQLGLGTVMFRVLQSSPTQVEIDTPSVGVREVGAGQYRISVSEDGTSRISVRSGQAELLGPQGSERVSAGQSVIVRGEASNPEMQNTGDVARDQFDDWNAGRDQEITASQSTQYVNTDVQGASDLDRYGNWVPSSTYGQVWQPQNVTPDWAPYSNGQWSYVDYYGWSWVDYSPWGWAPYHYGRWFNNPGYGWCWWPGSRLYPSYYSPALVGFYGIGAGLAWVALAPFEFFHPWWGYGRGFGFGYHGGYGLGSYRNAGFRGGVLFASNDRFGGPHQHFGFATRSQISSARVIEGRLPITNTRAAMNFSSRAVAANNRFSSIQNRSFYNGGQSRSFSQTSGPTSNMRSNTFGSSNAGAGWHSFGSSSYRAEPRTQAPETSGWHSFATPAPNNSSSYRAAPRATAPSATQQPRYNNNYSAPAGRSYGQPNYNSTAPRSYSQPNYSQPRGNYSAPRQNYSAPQGHSSAPAPRSSGGGGGGSHSSGSGGGGGHSSGGGGHHGR